VRIFAIILLLLLYVTSNIYASGAFPLNDPASILIGANKTYTIKDKETLVELAREYDIGYQEIVAANKDIDPWVPENGTEIIVPTRWILPDILDEGIIINLAEMRLYYFFSVNKNRYVKTYPIGIGRQGFNTPTGSFKITAKIKNPVWHVPGTIREEDPELPAFVPPGPDNPLGKYWLQLSINGYGIHGTNRPYGIGRRVSHGCIRLYPEDIEVLFKLLQRGTTVKIVDDPVKAGMYDNKIYIEVHPSDIDKSKLLLLAVKNLSRKHLIKYIETRYLIREINKATGLPAVISK
jgi:L,D-transpeptidase ErfK/SrfK